ncbi:Uncharacterized protein FKW44_020381 [Caligus rogercresseyi]|uniref:Uncharacterized protein n=1 Tax=Caligus rogercresseyi TaxID=217165 RepID=A0A7T8GXH1_CALRO|nr:Uncharacterized protein FKW44_020381 [Caligus rogercresseyi]
MCFVNSEMTQILMMHHHFPSLKLLIVSGHHTWFYGDGISEGMETSRVLGLMLSFEAPVYTNGYFIGFDGWESENEAYGASNVTWIVRVEFGRSGFKENKLRRHHRRYWLPGVKWVERNERVLYTHGNNLSLARRKTRSCLDIWVEPVCFLKHNGIARIYRISKTLKFEERELIELSKKMSKVSGIQCGCCILEVN